MNRRTLLTRALAGLAAVALVPAVKAESAQESTLSIDPRVEALKTLNGDLVAHYDDGSVRVSAPQANSITTITGDIHPVSQGDPSASGHMLSLQNQGEGRHFRTFLMEPSYGGVYLTRDGRQVVCRSGYDVEAAVKDDQVVLHHDRVTPRLT